LFKRIPLLVAFFLLFASVSSEINVLGPAKGVIENERSIELGSIMPGETLEIVLDRSFSDGKWSSASINQDLLPSGWRPDAAVIEDKSIKLLVFVPPKTRFGSQNLSITVTENATGRSEKINAIVYLKEDLVMVQMQSTQVRVPVNGVACYKLTLINNSVASHKANISSSLPLYWFAGEKAELKPRSSSDINLCVNAIVIGSRDFYFDVGSEKFNKKFHSLQAFIEVEPTAQGKYSAATGGFPFFMPTLAPFYFLNSLLSLLS